MPAFLGMQGETEDFNFDKCGFLSSLSVNSRKKKEVSIFRAATRFCLSFMSFSAHPNITMVYHYRY